MANSAYDTFPEYSLRAGFDIGSDTFKIAALDNTYVFDKTHQFYTSLTGILGQAVLTGAVAPAGVLDFDDPVIPGPLASPLPHAVAIFKWTGSGATSRLMLYFDTGLAFDVSHTGDVTVILPNDVNVKVFPMGGRPA